MVGTYSIDTSQAAADGVLPPIALSSCVPSYDATEDRGRRRQVAAINMAEDHHADERKRRILSSTSRDLARNFAVAAWAIRKHLSFVSAFNFQAKTPDRKYNQYLEEHWARRCAKGQFDVANRHPHRRAMRLAEACRVVDGDIWWLKLAPPKGHPKRGTIQAIEGDRILTPKEKLPAGFDPAQWLNGCRFDKATGETLEVAVCDRVNRSRYQLNRIVPAANIIQHAAYEFRFDQMRGVSPIAAALNWFRDTYETFEFTYAKIKTAQLFGLQIFRESSDGPLTGAGTATATTDTDGDGEEDAGYEVDFNRGPFMLDLDPGDRAEILESKNPSAETVAFLKLMIGIAIKSLDIPFSFFDESFSTFYGSRGSLINYLHGCKNTRADLIDLQKEHAAWRLSLDVADGELELPSGKDFSYLQYEFIPDEMPWWDTAKESRGASMAVAAGFTSPQRVCRENGTDFEANIDEIAAAMDYAEQARGGKGVPLVFADSTAFNPEIAVGEPTQTEAPRNGD